MKLQKHSFALYIRHFTQRPLSCRVLISPGGKKNTTTTTFYSFSVSSLFISLSTNMGKSKAPATTERRTSSRLALKPKSAETKKKAAPKKAAKPKKTKVAENGNKAEEPKAEATEAK